MKGDLTFTIIKPNVTKKNKVGEVIKLIEEGGFEIVAMEMIQLSAERASEFYKEHKEKVFFKPLIEFMVSGKSVVIALKKENAVDDFRQFIGSTNPKDARVGSIRRLYGESVTVNAIHGSDSIDSAEREIKFFFKTWNDLC